MTIAKAARVSAVSILSALVMLLVPALAWMQYQWLGQLSEAERERMQRTLRTAAAQFATEFDTELSRTLVSLQVDGADDSRSELDRVRAALFARGPPALSEPRLVRDVWLVDTLPGTALPPFDSPSPIPTDRLRIRRWNPQAMTFDAAEWPDDLQKIRDSLAPALHRLRGAARPPGREQPEHREAAISITLGDDTTLIAPVTLFELPDDHRGPPKISILGFTIVRLDPAVLRDTMLAALTARHFHGNDSGSGLPPGGRATATITSKLVWESEPGIASTVTSAPDVTQALHGAASRSDVRLRAGPARRLRPFHRRRRRLLPGAGSREPGADGSDGDQLGIRGRRQQSRRVDGRARRASRHQHASSPAPASSACTKAAGC